MERQAGPTLSDLGREAGSGVPSAQVWVWDPFYGRVMSPDSHPELDNQTGRKPQGRLRGGGPAAAPRAADSFSLSTPTPPPALELSLCPGRQQRSRSKQIWLDSYQ